MEQNGLAKTTINNTRKYLSYLSQKASLDNPDETKLSIMQKQCSEGHRKILLHAYQRYTKYYKLAFTMPKLHVRSRPIKVPTKEKVEALIDSAKSPMCIKLRISAETGLRPIQVYSLRTQDINLEQRLVYAQSAKDGNPITAKISTTLADQLAEYIYNNHITTGEKLFKGSQDDYCKHYRAYRNRLANKLHDPTIKTIRLYDLRHYFATTLYARTRDLLYVMQQMGHKNINTTVIYTHLLNLADDEYTVKTARTTEEATKILEAGYEYIQEIDGNKIYRKRE